jgi:cytochrome c oxidase subunit III
VRRQSAPAGHRAVDVATLPDTVFGPDALIWWGTAGFMVIEGSMFLMALITYFYLRLRVDEWPPSLPDPGLFYGTLNLAVLLVSIVPNRRAQLAAERFDTRRVRAWMVACVVFGIALLVIRAFEFTTLNCRWDDNAYGSIVWCLVVLHTTHIVTEVAEVGVLMALLFAGPIDRRRFVDVAESGRYWYFVVAWWLPIYATIYFAPRWL